MAVQETVHRLAQGGCNVGQRWAEHAHFCALFARRYSRYSCHLVTSCDIAVVQLHFECVGHCGDADLQKAC